MRWSVIAILSTIVAILPAFGGQTSPVAQPPRFEVPAPATTDPVSLAISPDGNKIVFSADFEGRYRLWVHSIDTGMARPLSGTEDVVQPFPCWSPDGKSIAYFGGNSLKRIDLDSNRIRTLTDTGRFVSGCSWGTDGTILFSAGYPYIRRVSAEGGVASRVTPSSPIYFKAPHFLPGGRHFLLAGGGSIYVAEIGGGEPLQLLEADSAAVYSRSGHLLYVRAGALYAQRFDPSSFELSGAPIPVAQNIPVASLYMTAVSTSASGSIVYRPAVGNDVRRFKWFDRLGKEIETVGEPVSGIGSALAPSRDLHSIAVNRLYRGNSDIWLIDLAGGKLTQFTTDPGEDSFPAWSGNDRIYFSSLRTGRIEMFQKPLSGDVNERLVIREPGGTRQARDVSPDGRFLLFTNGNGAILAYQLDGNPPSEIPFVAGGADFPQFSPDAQWVAYQTNESGRYEVFVKQFPSGRSFKISTDGGVQVRWRADGRELFYIGLDGKLMAVSAEPTESGQSLKLGTPKPLFTPALTSNLQFSLLGHQYVVSADGQRFLVATVETTKSPIQVIRNLQPN